MEFEWSPAHALSLLLRRSAEVCAFVSNAGQRILQFDRRVHPEAFNDCFRCCCCCCCCCFLFLWLSFNCHGHGNPAVRSDRVSRGSCSTLC